MCTYNTLHYISQGCFCTVQKMVVGVSLKATLASPKSHILSLQSAFAKIFLGFRSRWNTFAVKKQKRVKYMGFIDIHTNDHEQEKMVSSIEELPAFYSPLLCNIFFSSLLHNEHTTVCLFAWHVQLETL